MGARRDARLEPDRIPDGGQAGGLTRARRGPNWDQTRAKRGPDGVLDKKPDRMPDGVARWGPNGMPDGVADKRIITFKRKNNMFYIRVM
jgi:hypothetical protein